MFTFRAPMYGLNIRQSRLLRARPALLAGPTGQEQGVVIFEGTKIKAVLPTNQALRLANQITDAVEAHETGRTAP